MQKGDVAPRSDLSTANMFQKAGKALAGVDRAEEHTLGFGQFLDCGSAFRRRNGIVLTDEPVTHLVDQLGIDVNHGDSMLYVSRQYLLQPTHVWHHREHLS